MELRTEFLREAEEGAVYRVSLENAGRRARRTPKSERERLRAVYRDYLNFLRSKGVSPGPSETTAEISQDASALLIESDESLRALYRRARYSAGAVSPAEVDAAAELLARLKQAENLRSHPS